MISPSFTSVLCFLGFGALATAPISYRDVVSGQDSGLADRGLLFLRHAFDEGQLVRGPVNSFHQRDGERLPRGVFQNHAGLLVRGAVNCTLTLEDQQTVAQEIPILLDHVVVASLVTGNVQGDGPCSWWTTLQDLASPGAVNFHRRVGQRVIYIRTDGLATTQRFLAQAFHEFDGGAVFYQSWSKGFNPRTPANLFWPMWITLRELPLEY